MSDITILSLFFAGILAGICNAVAGGGTFFTFPAMLAAGIPPVVANASNAIAVWPGHAMAVIGYRKDYANYPFSLRGSFISALCGAILGAYLMLKVDNATFSKLVPMLVLFATLIFLFGPRIHLFLSKNSQISNQTDSIKLRGIEFLVSVYGGFFGAGLGIMLMAGLLIAGVHEIQTNNAIKNLLATIITTVSVVIFAVSDLVSWPHTIAAFAGAVIGGILGTKFARRLPQTWLRRIVISVGLILFFYYAGKIYL
ncbi:MAG: sulfite exporter TauE/SafE family protein [Burkholderiales bacterium]|nr:sulfite exporter TauE/SafE family protein [Burkholderiales bacterium]